MYKTLRFFWKASGLSSSDLHELCLSLLCDLAIDLARVYIHPVLGNNFLTPQSQLLSWPLIFPKALSSQSSVSKVKQKVSECFSFYLFYYSARI